MLKMIGIAGRAGSGKDTLADYLVKEYGFKRFAFADPLKECLAQIPGWDHRHMHGDLKDQVDPHYNVVPRHAMQRLGTECFRALNPDFWIRVAERVLDPDEETPIVISDVRFENEAAFVRRRGLLVHLRRNQVPAGAHHQSEAGVFRTAEDVVVENNAGIDRLWDAVDELMFEIKRWGMYGNAKTK